MVEPRTTRRYPTCITHLFNERLAEADAEFQKIIDSGLYDLVEDYRDNGGYENENVDGEDDPRLHGMMFYNAPDMTVYGDTFQVAYADNLDQNQPAA